VGGKGCPFSKSNKAATEVNIMAQLFNIMGIIGHSFVLLSYAGLSLRLGSFGYAYLSSCITVAVWLCQ